ncbi:hypothetical protein OA79_04320 [Marinomonas sp. TW1]|nr:hypothetical protein OA79_04320 [Marinomonas sp. TW1]
MVMFFVFISIAWTILYVVFGASQAKKLGEYICHEDYLKLWNVTQLYVFTSIGLDFELKDDYAKKLFLRLRRTIIIFYSVALPLFIFTNVLHMFYR